MHKYQVAAIPYQIDSAGQLRVLLVTSKRSRRWVLPKGKAARRLPPYAAAAREAFEEAGVLGTSERLPIGRYRQRKRQVGDQASEILVEAYGLAVSAELTSWPERRVRQRSWMTIAEAIESVDDADLRGIIRLFGDRYAEEKRG